VGHIGLRSWAIDWEARTLGAAPYTADIAPKGALFGVILRSPHAHARIESIDVSAARQMPGVQAVITTADFPPHARYMHERVFDRPPLAEGIVRFVGQEVAAVAAETLEQARHALGAIRVKYHLLPAPFCIAEALATGAAVLHTPEAAVQSPVSGGGPATAATAKGGAPPGMPAPPYAFNVAPNVRRAFRRQWGNAQHGREEASVSVSGRFWFGQQTHVCMETNRTLADWSGDGRLHLWTSTAAPVHIQRQVAFVLGISPAQIRIHEVAVGGSFGSKANVCEHEAIAAVLARAAKRPVLVALTREEEFETTKTRHGFEVDLMLRADASGKLLAVEGAICADNGAYVHSGGSVTSASVISLGMMYDADRLDVDVKLVDTSKTPGGAMRGYGTPQTLFALESLMDELALKLGRDPSELRIQNAYSSHVQALAGHVGENGLADCIRTARMAIGWDQERANKQPGRGVGMAAGEHVSGAHILPDSNRCDGIIDLYADGRLRVRFGGSDCGTGQKTILAQIAAHELGVPLERIGVYSMDTDETGWDLGAWSSRGTHYTGQAIALTAREFAAKLKTLAARQMRCADIHLEAGAARGAGGEILLGELVGLSPESVEGVLTHKASFIDATVELLTSEGRGNISATHNYGAHAAIVQVDEKTGHVEVLDYAAALDSGTALNPLLLEGQVVGGVVMGLGAALGGRADLRAGEARQPGVPTLRRAARRGRAAHSTPRGAASRSQGPLRRERRGRGRHRPGGRRHCECGLRCRGRADPRSADHAGQDPERACRKAWPGAPVASVAAAGALVRRDRAPALSARASETPPSRARAAICRSARDATAPSGGDAAESLRAEARARQ
jgi:CO/xanthine dehydrogenase Mo-binding subunit